MAQAPPSLDRPVYQVNEAATRRDLSVEENAALLLRHWDYIRVYLDDPPSCMHLTQAGLKSMLEYDQESENKVAEKEPK